MVVTVYISGISGNKEVKKRQQRVQMILESRGIAYEAIDIAEPGRQAERDRLKHCGATTPVLPPQLFNGDDYCGDYDQFDLANEIDEVEKFLKLSPGSTSVTTNGNKESVDNGINDNTTNETKRISPEHELEKTQEENSEEKLDDTPQNSTEVEKDDKDEHIDTPAEGDGDAEVEDEEE